MGSLLQLLSLSRWEVFCSLQTKMQSLVLLLSATLATVAYGAANPGGHHFGHAYHDGPHCHDKKDHQCHKKPKQQEHEECYVDYDIIVDVTYIEECEYVVITHCNEEHEQVYHNSHIVKGESEVVDAHHEDYAGDYHKRSANPGDHGHSSGPYCEDKKEKQCHKHPKENTRKIPKQTCKKIVDTIYVEECEERIHTHCEETHERGHFSERVTDRFAESFGHSHKSGHASSSRNYH